MRKSKAFHRERQLSVRSSAQTGAPISLPFFSSASGSNTEFVKCSKMQTCPGILIDQTGNFQDFASFPGEHSPGKGNALHPAVNLPSLAAVLIMGLWDVEK
jgi:hypothetical protein